MHINRAAGCLTGLSFPDIVRVLRGTAESRSIRVIPCIVHTAFSGFATKCKVEGGSGSLIEMINVHLALLPRALCHFACRCTSLGTCKLSGLRASSPILEHKRTVSFTTNSIGFSKRQVEPFQQASPSGTARSRLSGLEWNLTPPTHPPQSQCLCTQLSRLASVRLHISSNSFCCVDRVLLSSKRSCSEHGCFHAQDAWACRALAVRQYE